jgi:hypothetical protein
VTLHAERISDAVRLEHHPLAVVTCESHAAFRAHLGVSLIGIREALDVSFAAVATVGPPSAKWAKALSSAILPVCVRRV